MTGNTKLGFCHVQDKVKYLTRKDAERFIESKGYALRAYHCTDCDYFHLTSQMTHNRRMRLVKPAIKKRKKPRRLL